MPDKVRGRGYSVAPDELNALVKTLGEIADAIGGLIVSADRLGQRSPLLGTAPPALALADRLRATAGQAGLTGELGTAKTRLREYHGSLTSALGEYINVDKAVSSTIDTAGSVVGTATGVVKGLLQ